MTVANDWQFDKIVPDADDLAAKAKACQIYHHLVQGSDGAREYNEIDYFHAGFMRGMAWAIYKRQQQIEAIIAQINASGDAANVIWELLRKLPVENEFYVKYMDKGAGK